MTKDILNIKERTWWRLLQKRVVRTKFDIYVFILFIDDIKITFNYDYDRHKLITIAHVDNWGAHH